MSFDPVGYAMGLMGGIGRDIVSSLMGRINSGPAVLRRIECTIYPDNTSYYVGESLDLTGAVITAIYSNGSKVDVTADCVFAPADGATITQDGVQTVRVDYEDEAGSTATCGISIAVCPVNTQFGFHLTSELTQPLYLTVNGSSSSSSTIDWGDGSEADTLAAGANQLSHTYAAAGDYTVVVTVPTGLTLLIGARIGGKDYGLCGLLSKSETFPTLAWAKLGMRTLLAVNSFRAHIGLANILMGDSITLIPNGAFFGCGGMTGIDLNESVSVIDQNGLNGTIRNITVRRRNLISASADSFSAGGLLISWKFSVRPESVTLYKANTTYSAGTVQSIEAEVM